jgi:LPS export ABC transporter protein LptC
MRRARRTILLLAIVASLGAIGYKVAGMVQSVSDEVKANPLKALDYLPESALQIKDFHRSKIENGRKVWELFGEEANYYKDQKEAVIKKPRFYYYDKKGEVAETQGDEAVIYLNEKQLDKMELRGDVQVSFQGYVLTSEGRQENPAPPVGKNQNRAGETREEEKKCSGGKPADRGIIDTCAASVC